MPRYIKLLIRKNCIIRFFHRFSPFPIQPCFFLSSNKKIYLLMFFQAVKFLLACIFLENESIFHFLFFFFSVKVTLSLLQGCPLTEHPPHTTLKQTYFCMLRKWEPGSLEPILGQQRNGTIYGIGFTSSKKQGLKNPYNFSITTESFTQKQPTQLW